MISLIRLLYGSFPREVDVHKHRTVHCWDAFVSYVNSVNGRVKMPAVSLYAYDGFTPVGDLDHSRAGIDKLLYDFDWDDTSYNATAEARKLDRALNEADWRHFIEMSGGGIHIMPFLEVVKYDFPSSAIMNFREYLQDQGFRFDQSVVAHVAQMVRICGTYNLPRRLWCVPITSHELQTKTKEELQALGRQYRNIPDGRELMFISGCKLKTLRKFDAKRPGFDEADWASPQFASSEIIPVRPEDVKRGCCRVPPDANNVQRFMLITHLIEMGFNSSSIEQHLERVLSPSKYNHCIKEERQLDRLMERGAVCYDCSKIKELGLDNGQCPICRWPQIA